MFHSECRRGASDLAIFPRSPLGRIAQPGGPLIIDQPEGDLDNRIIEELTDKLHEAKENRQLIFASHNANIFVNGSAELVGHLDLKDSGDRKFAITGAIDKPEVCKVITSTMEDGEKAFKDRQDKYGWRWSWFVGQFEGGNKVYSG